MIFGILFGIFFALYLFDDDNVAALANCLEAHRRINADSTVRVLFASAAILLGIVAFIRTWACAYLNAAAVYASNVKTDFLVADRPYRLVRNPLYFAKVLMAAARGSMMSWPRFVFAVASMPVFFYRLILREESQLASTQGASYAA